jgi:predicted RND superfamily exporter protein
MAAAPVDRFTARHRIPIVVITILVVLLGTPLLANLPFDFNPTHLQDPNDKSVKTFLEVKGEPQAGANAIEIQAPDLQSTDRLARQLGTIPQVSQATTLSSFIPQGQQEKIKLVRRHRLFAPLSNRRRVKPQLPMHRISTA